MPENETQKSKITRSGNQICIQESSTINPETPPTSINHDHKCRCQHPSLFNTILMHSPTSNPKSEPRMSMSCFPKSNLSTSNLPALRALAHSFPQALSFSLAPNATHTIARCNRDRISATGNFASRQWDMSCAHFTCWKRDMSGVRDLTPAFILWNYSNRRGGDFGW